MAKIKLNINNLKTISREQSKLEKFTSKIQENVQIGFTQLTDSSTRTQKFTPLKPSFREFEKPNSNKSTLRGGQEKPKEVTLKKVLTSIWIYILNLFIKTLKYIFIWISSRNRFGVVKFVTFFIFGLIILHLANLQIFSYYISASNNIDPSSNLIRRSIIENQKKGQIYIQDFARNQTKISLTSTQNIANLSIDPLALKTVINKNKLKVEELTTGLAGNLNLSYNTVFDLINQEISKENPSRYVILVKGISEQQKKVATFLIEQSENKNSYFTWLGIRENITRSYPFGELLGSTLGYIPKYNVSREEGIKTECRQMIEDNDRSGASSLDYSIGYYGLEQKYCSTLAGRNGRTVILGNKLNNEDSLPAQNGSDIYLTLDLTMQQKAEEILAKVLKDNTNANGKPRNASMIVLNPKTGKVLALASAPSFDPNVYGQGEISTYRNVATSEDYEVGSVMKPLTVAAALSEYEKGTTGSQGQRIGVPENWEKADYDTNGKIYKELNGAELRISNSQNLSYSGRKNNLKLVIRDSINTLISDITDTLGNIKMRDYFVNRFEFNKPTEATFAGGGNGNLSSLEKNMDCQYCFAQHGFGQGIAISTIQLARAYTALANRGQMVEPFIIEKIVDQNGKIDDGKGGNSILNRPEPKSVFTEQSAKLTTSYMQSVMDEGYLGQQVGKNSIPGYSIAAKTGTAQITRQYKGSSCDYTCNTEKGLFDHTLIGYGPTANSQVMIVIKISEPKPGVVTNFADTSLMPGFREMMGFSLDYLKIPRDK